MHTILLTGFVIAMGLGDPCSAAVAQDLRVTAEGGEIAYDAAGEGPAVVFIHGGLVDRRIWDRQFQALCDEYRVIRYDVRPLGDSRLDAPTVSHLDDLARVLDELAVDRATLVGHSFGGMIALDFALEHPERVERLVLAGASLRGFPYGQDERLRQAYQLARSDTAAAIRMLVDSTSMVSDDERARRTFARLLADNAAQWTTPNYHLRARWPEVETIHRLSDVVAPTLVLVGDDDYPDLLKTARLMARRIPGSRLTVIPGAAHHLSLDRPTLFDEALRAFLSAEMR